MREAKKGKMNNRRSSLKLLEILKFIRLLIIRFKFLKSIIRKGKYWSVMLIIVLLEGRSKVVKNLWKLIKYEGGFIEKKKFKYYQYYFYKN